MTNVFTGVFLASLGGLALAMNWITVEIFGIYILATAIALNQGRKHVQSWKKEEVNTE